ncbi:MAG: redoxin domain-containing protein [Acidobacteriota bacterium]
MSSVWHDRLVTDRAVRCVTIFLTLCLTLFAIADGHQSPTLQWDFSLQDAHGRTHSRHDFAKAKAAVFFFLATECPISNRYAPEINRIVADYSNRGIRFYSVYSDPDLKTEAVRKHAVDYAYGFPALIDRGQTIAAQFEVTLTPTMLIVSPEGRLIYRGRIDTRYLDFGRYREAGIVSDGRIALDAVTAGRNVQQAVTRPIGCALPPLHSQSSGVQKR